MIRVGLLTPKSSPNRTNNQNKYQHSRPNATSSSNCSLHRSRRTESLQDRSLLLHKYSARRFRLTSMCSTASKRLNHRPTLLCTPVSNRNCPQIAWHSNITTRIFPAHQNHDTTAPGSRDPRPNATYTLKYRSRLHHSHKNATRQPRHTEISAGAIPHALNPLSHRLQCQIFPNSVPSQQNSGPAVPGSLKSSQNHEAHRNHRSTTPRIRKLPPERL